MLFSVYERRSDQKDSQVIKHCKFEDIYGIDVFIMQDKMRSKKHLHLSSLVMEMKVDQHK